MIKYRLEIGAEKVAFFEGGVGNWSETTKYFHLLKQYECCLDFLLLFLHLGPNMLKSYPLGASLSHFHTVAKMRYWELLRP